MTGKTVDGQCSALNVNEASILWLCAKCWNNGKLKKSAFTAVVGKLLADSSSKDSSTFEEMLEQSGSSEDDKVDLRQFVRHHAPGMDFSAIEDKAWDRLLSTYLSAVYVDRASQVAWLKLLARYIPEEKMSVPFLERAVKLQEAMHATYQDEEVNLLMMLAKAHWANNDFQSALDAWNKAAEVASPEARKRGEVGKILHYVGLAHGKCGDQAKKREFLERALREKEAAVTAGKAADDGKDVLEIAKTLLSLGNLHIHLGVHFDAKKAKDYLTRAVRMLEKSAGAPYNRLSAGLSDLGMACIALGEAKQAREHLERSLKIEEDAALTLPQSSFDALALATVKHNLGNACWYSKDASRARDLQEQALKVYKARLGSTHPDVAALLNDLGAVYGDLDNQERKRDLMEESLTILETHHGPEHLMLAPVLNNLGNCYAALGNFKKNKALQERALAILSKPGDPNGREAMAKTLHSLGLAYGDLGDAKKKKELIEQAVKMYRTEAHMMAGLASGLRALSTCYTGSKQKQLIQEAEHLERKLGLQRSPDQNDKQQSGLPESVKAAGPGLLRQPAYKLAALQRIFCRSSPSPTEGTAAARTPSTPRKQKKEEDDLCEAAPRTASKTWSLPRPSWHWSRSPQAPAGDNSQSMLKGTAAAGAANESTPQRCQKDNQEQHLQQQEENADDVLHEAAPRKPSRSWSLRRPTWPRKSSEPRCAAPTTHARDDHIPMLDNQHHDVGGLLSCDKNPYADA